MQSSVSGGRGYYGGKVVDQGGVVQQQHVGGPFVIGGGAYHSAPPPRVLSLQEHLPSDKTELGGRTSPVRVLATSASETLDPTPPAAVESLNNLQRQILDAMQLKSSNRINFLKSYRVFFLSLSI